MSTTLTGTVIHTDIVTRLDDAQRLIYVHLRVIARQAGRGSARWQAVLVTGSGNDALRRAESLRSRLSIGCVCEAHGETVQPLQPEGPDDPELVLRGVAFLRLVEASRLRAVGATPARPGPVLPAGIFGRGPGTQPAPPTVFHATPVEGAHP